MRKPADNREFEDLSVPEKILRVQDLWDRIARTPEAVVVTEAQRRELGRRLAAHEKNPGHYTSWNELRNRLMGK